MITITNTFYLVKERSHEALHHFGQGFVVVPKSENAKREIV